MEDCIIQDDTVPWFSLNSFFFCIPAKLGFYSICTQTFQRNLEPDPLPALCVVRDSDRIIIITAKHHKKGFLIFLEPDSASFMAQYKMCQ